MAVGGGGVGGATSVLQTTTTTTTTTIPSTASATSTTSTPISSSSSSGNSGSGSGSGSGWWFTSLNEWLVRNYNLHQSKTGTTTGTTGSPSSPSSYRWSWSRSWQPIIQTGTHSRTATASDSDSSTVIVTPSVTSSNSSSSNNNSYNNSSSSSNSSYISSNNYNYSSNNDNNNNIPSVSLSVEPKVTCNWVYKLISNLLAAIMLPIRRALNQWWYNNWSVSNSVLSSHSPEQRSMKKVLVLDLDETLVHATTKPLRNVRYDMTVDVVIEGVSCRFFVTKRPHVDLFLQNVCKWFEVIVFTASLRQYADPVIDKLDPSKRIVRRLFRESCVNKGGLFIKDLTCVQPDLAKIAIIDNSPIAYSMQNENAIPISDFFGDNTRDEALLQLLPFLHALRFTSDVRSILSLRR